MDNQSEAAELLEEIDQDTPETSDEPLAEDELIVTDHQGDEVILDIGDDNLTTKEIK